MMGKNLVTAVMLNELKDCHVLCPSMSHIFLVLSYTFYTFLTLPSAERANVQLR